MKILITGAAGFIGSHLSEYFLRETEHEVIGVDGFLREELQVIGTRNIQSIVQHERFTLIRANMLELDWAPLLADVDVVYHLAGIPGVRSSFGKQFVHYADSNIVATQQLLEASRGTRIKKFIFASTSSVYGEKIGQVAEDATLEPLSPYGVTKHTCEQLCRIYRHIDHVPVVVLRFFTVYGPRQRSDMAFHLFIRSMLKNDPILVYGDGTQSRDFTFIRDCVQATAQVALRDGLIGETINIGGKERASVNDVIATLSKLMGRQAIVHYTGATQGEPKHTWADITKAKTLLNYEPAVTLAEGLALELQDLVKLYS